MPGGVDPTWQDRLIALLKSSRPPGWTFGPILYGIGVIHSRNIPRTLGDLFKAVVQIGSLSLPLCIIVFGINDVYDYESDLLNPRKSESSLEGTILQPVYHNDVRRAAWASTALIIGIFALTGRRQTFLAALGLVFLGWQYSAPPLRLKEVPVIDSISNGLIVLLASFIGFTSRGGSVANAPRSGYLMALVCAGVHALGAAVDIEADLQAGQRTIATFLGARASASIAAAFYATAVAIEDLKTIFGVYVLGGFFITASAAVNIKWVHRSFQVVVYWTVVMAMIWFGARGKEILAKIMKRD